MSKRIWAALAALLIALPVLTIVSASPASAHTQTVRRCAYDPFAGNQCWNESVPHTHPKPKPKTSTNYSPPPDTTPRDTSAEDTSAEDTSATEDTSAEDTSATEDTSQTCQPWPNCRTAQPKDGGGSTSTAAADPCQTWLDNTRRALNTPGPDGIPDVTPAPEQCKKPDNPVWAALKDVFNAIAEDTGGATLSEAEIRGKSGKEIAAWIEQNHEAIKRHWNSLPKEVRTATKAGVCFSVLAAAAADPEPATKTLLAGALVSMGCAVVIDDIEEAVFGTAPTPTPEATPDTTPGTVPKETQPTCQPWPNCRTLRNSPSDAAPDATPDTTPDATPTTVPPPKLSNSDLAKAQRQKEDGIITPEELEAIKARYRCQLGFTSYC